MLVLHAGVARAATPQALILGDTVSEGLAPDGSGDSLEQYEAQLAGFDVTVVDGTTWDSMTAAQFAAYQVLIIGDPTCGFNNFTAALTNETTWEPVVMGSGGNKVIIGTDPTFHWDAGHPGGGTLEEQGIAYAGEIPGATGAYVDLSCTYTDAADNTPVPLLDGLSSSGPGQFTVGGAPCAGAISVIAATGPTSGMQDSDLSEWECSVHEFFDTFPPDYTPLSLATDPTVPDTYSGTDVSTGTPATGSPYILISGSGITISSNLSVTPTTQTLNVSTAGTVTGTLINSTDSTPVANASVTFDVTSGPDAGQTFTGLTNASGQVTFTYTNSGTAGTDQILATTVVDGITQQGTASITWMTGGTTTTTTPAATSLATSLTGNGQSGATITVPTGTSVTDQASLTGANASGATGTVTYNVYLNSACTTSASAGSPETISTAGTLPASQAVTFTVAGTYYWQAVYSGDANNASSTSPCNEILTVTPPAVVVNTSKAAPHCPVPAGGLGGSAVGVFTIGMTQTQARLLIEWYHVTENKFDNFCLYHGWGIRLGYPTNALLKTIPAASQAQFQGHVVLALTANPFYLVNGATAGMTEASVAARLKVGKPFKVGSNQWYFAWDGPQTAILKVRKGVIQEVGLASLPLTKSRSLQRVFIHSFDKL